MRCRNLAVVKKGRRLGIPEATTRPASDGLSFHDSDFIIIIISVYSSIVAVTFAFVLVLISTFPMLLFHPAKKTRWRKHTPPSFCKRPKGSPQCLVSQPGGSDSGWRESVWPEDRSVKVETAAYQERCWCCHLLEPQEKVEETNDHLHCAIDKQKSKVIPIFLSVGGIVCSRGAAALATRPYICFSFTLFSVLAWQILPFFILSLYINYDWRGCVWI